MSVA
jgi:hypothetical protein